MAETVVDIQDAQSRLPELIEQAAAGEAIIIAKGGKPLARLMPPTAAVRPRQPGGWEGKVWISEDFDDPLPPDILRHFTNGGSP
jgi:prevent-host-death family protein